MKYIYYYTAILCFMFINCKAQIVDIDSGYIENDQGYYYKDLFNVLDPFVGTYLYTNGNNSFEVILQKKEYANYNNYYHEDILIGAYRIVKDGIEVTNNLSTINEVYSDGWDYLIHGNNILTGNTLRCTDCGVNEKWVRGLIKDPVSDSHDHLFIRKIMVGSQEAIKIWIYHEIPMTTVGESGLQGPISYPLGEEIILIKQ